MKDGDNLNLKRQLYYAVQQCCKFGADKHSSKNQNYVNKSNIYSYADRRNLLNIYSQFSNYLKENNIEIKMCKDLNYKHIQSFLNNKAKTCNRETLKCYFSAFNKLGYIINFCYHTNISLNGYVLPPTTNNTKLRNISMTKEDFNKIQNYLNNSQGFGKIGLQIAKISGMRSEEICKLKYKDVNILGNSAKIKVVDAKGKRNREILVTKTGDVNYLKSLICTGTDLNSRICPIQSDSLNRSIRRAMQATDIDKKYPNTTIHSIRKMYSQDLYSELRCQGYTPQQSWNQVSKSLGHGENRPDLLKIYISNLY
ncbi:MAG: tyrosine-type recombinase/integrase [Anaerotignaceae bacterium]